MSKKVYLEFSVEIREEEYRYGCAAAQEALSVTLPSLEFFSRLDVGTLFDVLSLNLEEKFEQALKEKAKHE